MYPGSMRAIELWVRAEKQTVYPLMDPRAWAKELVRMAAKISKTFAEMVVLDF